MGKSAPVIYVKQLTPRELWKLAEHFTLTLNVGKRRFDLPRLVRSVLIYPYARRFYPVRIELYAMPDLMKAPTDNGG